MSKPNRPQHSMLLEQIKQDYVAELGCVPLSILVAWDTQELLEQIEQDCKLNGCPLDERYQCLPGHCALTGESESSFDYAPPCDHSDSND